MTLKLGKLPARAGAVSFKMSTFLDTTVLPATPRYVGHPRLLPADVGMLGNDRYGDCVFAGAAHESMLYNLERKKVVQFDDAAVLSDYSAVTGFNPNNPASDQGTDMQVAASYRRKTGIVDSFGMRHQIAAYLALETGNFDQLKTAVHLFGAVGIGIQFPQSAMDQFNAGKPWTPVAGSPVEGGHYIPVVGITPKTITVLTWGRKQKMSIPFFMQYCDEALAYVSLEALNAKGLTREGFNASQLVADLAVL